MKFYIFLIVFLSLFYAKGQTLYHDNYIKIVGYKDSAEGSLFFQIENISDSVIVLNAKNINFENVRENEWSADLSLFASDLSLLKPSFGHFMSFKRLIPKTKHTAVAYDFPLPRERDSFKLYIQIDYMIIPKKIVNG